MTRGMLVARSSSLSEGAGGPRESNAKSAPTSATRLRPDAATFQEVYRTFFADVCRWVRALGGTEAERDDLVQDVFVIVHRRLPDFDGQNIHGWLYQITRHRVRDFRRLRWFRVFLHSRAVDETMAVPAGGSSAESALGDKEHAEILRRLLAKLPEAQRAAFVLFEVDGYSGEEIARIQGVPLNTVWGRIHKARAKLAESVARLQKNSGRGWSAT